MNAHDVAPASLLRRVASIVSESFDTREVVFDPRNGLVRRLNRTASELWRMLETPQARSVIVATIRERSQEKSTHIESDVLRFIDELIMWGLVENVDG